MQKMLLLFMFIILSAPKLFAEEDVGEVFKNLYAEQNYDEILKHLDESEDYSSKALYYFGMAYYMKSDDQNCLKYLNKCIDKDSSNLDAYFIIGKTYYYMSEYEKSILNIRKAISIDSTRSIFYSGLADTYLELQNTDSALKYYQISYDLGDAPEQTYFMLPQVYGALNMNDKVIEYSYIAKEQIARDTDRYLIVLYNIGLFEYLAHNYDKAEDALVELLSIKPDDYLSIPKLIQVYYAKKKYDMAKPLKEVLYEAEKKGLLNEPMDFMFCFDQFTWNGKHIQVHERYAEPDGKLYYKHLFYILDEDENIEFRIQTENSPILVSMGTGKYLLGMNKGDMHYTFNIGFGEDFNYEELKQAVIDILDGKIKPGASSTRASE